MKNSIVIVFLMLLCNAAVLTAQNLNLMRDGGFESTATTYFNQDNTGIFAATIATIPNQHSGIYCVKQLYTPGYTWNTVHQAAPYVNCGANKKYKLKVWNKNTVSVGDIYIGMRFLQLPENSISYAWQKIPNNSSSWQNCTMEFTTPAGAEAMTPYLWVDSNVSSGDVFWDDITIEPVTNMTRDPGYENTPTTHANQDSSGIFTITRETTNPYSGAYCAKQLYTPGYTWNTIRQSPPYVNCVANKKYKLKVWNRNTVSSGDIYIGMRFLQLPENSISYAWQKIPNNSTSWQQCTMEFTTPAGAEAMNPYLRVDSNVSSGDVLWDDLTVEDVNITRDAGFEDIPTNYTCQNGSSVALVTQETTNPHSGSYCARQFYTSGSTWNTIRQAAPYVFCGEKQTYRLTVWNRNTVSSGDIYIGMRFLQLPENSISYAWQKIPNNSASWQQCTMEFTTPAGTEAMNPYLWVASNVSSGDVFWDDISIESAGIHAVDYAGNPNSPDQNAINAAIQAIGANQATMILDGANWNINSNVSIPSNITLKIEDKILVNIASGVSLTVNGAMNTSSTPKFTGSGNVVINYQNAVAVPQWWGAVANDYVDCGPAIRKAISSGAKKIYLSPGTYLVKTLGGLFKDSLEYAFELPSNVSIFGDGIDSASIKMDAGVLINSSALYGGGVFWLDQADNVTLGNFTINMNGFNNLIPQGSIKACYAVKAKNSNHVNMENVKFLNTPGRNYIVLEGGSFNSTKSCVLVNGGTSLSGNTNQTDFSAIYVNSTDSTVEYNSICHDNFPFWFSGGIELHASRIMCRNNYIEKSYPAAFIICDNGDTTNTGCTFQNNTASQCVRGVVMGGGQGTIDNLLIANNYFSLLKLAAMPEHPSFGILMSAGGGSGDGVYTDVKVTNSTITGNTMDDLDYPVPSSPRTNFIRMSGFQNVVISNNTVNKTSGDAIVIEGNPYDFNDVTISGNTLSNFGTNSSNISRFGIFFCLTGYSTYPITRSDFNSNNFQIINNTISRTPASNAWAFHFNWDDGALIQNLLVQGNSLTTGLQVKAGPKSNLVNVLP